MTTYEASSRPAGMPDRAPQASPPSDRRPATPQPATSQPMEQHPAGRGTLPPSAEDQLEQLRFLHEVARLATTARTWDELLETVVDRTRDVLHADVSSLYLLDRDGAYLTLAATNGLDRFQIGRARVPFGEGVTGRVAADRRPAVIHDVRADQRFLWVRGIDQRRFVASMLSVPLTWHDQIVGVLNVQTEQAREFSEHDLAQLGAVADLLAGIIEKGRQQTEAEARVEALKAIDEARSELIALVTHELRTPLAVVRAYTDLLAEEPPLRGRESRDLGRRQTRAAWHRATLEQIERLDRLVDSILASVRVVPEGPAAVTPVDLGALVNEVVASLRPILERHRVEIMPSVRLHGLADPPRLRQIVEHLLENAVKYAPPETAIRIDWGLHEGVVQLGVSDEGPGIPDEWRERIFEPYARRDTHTARGSGIGLYAAKRLGESMGVRLWCEPARPHGARFVVALPAAVAI
ncbi:MAG: GAF domain-containing sensor histidine kinase [Candidatus Limnocylindrales bacterium]